MTKLALRRCTPVKKGSKPISAGIARSLLNQVNNKWRLDPQAKFIEREFDFTDFRRTIEFVNAVAWVANGQDHHPDLEVNYGRCKVRYSTHAAGGLTVNDFICAAKIDALFSDEKLKISPSSPKRQHPASPAAVGESPSIGNRETLSEESIQLSLDSKEVEELLNKKLDEDEEPTTQDTDDEFELIDPETIRPPDPPKEAPAAAQKEPQPTVSAKENPAIIEGSHAELDLTSTVILPPGMQVVGKKPDDEEEDSTVILPEDTAIDPEETIVNPPEKAPEKAASTLLPPAPPAAKADEDEVRTVIMNPSLSTVVEKPAVPPSGSPSASKPGNPKPFPANSSVSLPPLSPKTDNEEVGTMILSSNPFNHPAPKPQTSPDASKAVKQDAAGQNNSSEKQLTSSTTDKPASEGDEKEADYMGTMVMSAAEIEAMTRKQPQQKPTPPKKVDEDDTLVMHVNDFKKLNND